MRLDILEMFRKQAQLDPTIGNRVSESTPMHQGGKEGRGVSNTGKPAFPTALKRKSQAIHLSCLPRHQLDPRPDLKDDHRLWMTVLAQAWMMDERGAKTSLASSAASSSEQQGSRLPGRPFHGLLHGLRCGGAQLKKLRNRSGKEFLKLIYQPLLVGWKEDSIIKDWLGPYKEQMKACFDVALDLYERCNEPGGQQAGWLGTVIAETEAKVQEQAQPARPSQARFF